jgi:hypothetical protein
MKKTTRKLVLRKETIRELSVKALTHVIGGQDTDNVYPYSGPKQCMLAAMPQSGDKQCLG